jgi:perosamine synthetase
MIPVNETLLNGNEKRYLIECIDSGWISSEGPFVEKFENGFAKFTGVKYGVAVSSGTAALEAALYALGISQGDEVILPSFTIISCAVACLRIGARPVLIDIDPDTWTMDVSQIEAKINHKTRAIMPVHIYGHPVQMDPIFNLKEKYNIKILEDAAEVHGARYYSQKTGQKWLNCGSMGDAAATSFYANKIISTGEGGMILTDNGECAARARSYRNLCFRPEKRFYHTEIGYNFRMTNMQAAVGFAQLERIEELIARKRRLGKYYRKALANIPGVRFQVEKSWARSVYWMYSIELNPELGLDADTVCERLKEKGIGTRPFFMGLHAQPALHKLNIGIDPQGYPRTDYACKYGFYLPSGMNLTEEQIDTVCQSLDEALKGK